MNKLILYFCIVALCAGCRENQQPKDVVSQSPQNQLELRMAGRVGTEGVTFLLSSEFRKISAEMDALDSAKEKNAHNNFISIDSTGTALSSRLFMESDPEKIIGKLNECFFRQMNIVVKKQPESFENSLPDRIYESKKASVAGACLLMLLLGEKADIPLSLLSVNSHYFVRFDNGRIRRNIELLSGGSEYPDSWYISNFAKDTLDTLRTLSSREAAGVLYYNAALSMNREHQDAAITGFAKALENYPLFTNAQHQIDLIVDNSKKQKTLLEHLLAIKIANPSLWALDRSLALLYFRTGDYKAAAEYYERALSHQPDAIALIKGAGISYLNIHDYSTAKKYLTNAHLAAPSDSQVTKWLAECP